MSHMAKAEKSPFDSSLRFYAVTVISDNSKAIQKPQPVYSGIYMNGSCKTKMPDAMVFEVKSRITKSAGISKIFLQICNTYSQEIYVQFRGMQNIG